jgi:hypothetical protein
MAELQNHLGLYHLPLIKCLLHAPIFILSAQLSYGTNIILLPILQAQQLRFRKSECLAHGLILNYWTQVFWLQGQGYLCSPQLPHCGFTLVTSHRDS